MIFLATGTDYPEKLRSGEVVKRRLDGPNVLIGANEGLSDAAEATRIQKPLVDMIRGLLLLAGPPGALLILPPVWEGVLRKSSPETIALEAGRLEATALDVSAEQLRRWGSRWQSFDPRSISPELGFALRWYYKGVSSLFELSGERIDAFIALWLCAITLIRAWHAQNLGGDPSEMERFIAYAEQRLKLAGNDFEDAKKQFEQVRDRRNELFKGGGGMVISQEEATTAANLAHRVLDYEIELHG